MTLVIYSNIDKINSAIGFDLSTTIQLIAAAISVVIIGIFINWKLTLIMTILIPFVVITMRLFSKVYHFGSSTKLK